MTRFTNLKLLAPALLLCLSLSARADTVVVIDTAPVYQAPRWGIGLSLGEPTGITAKRYLGGRNAFDVYVGGAYGPGIRFGFDYLWGIAQLLSDRSSADLNFYLGVGPFVGVLRGPCAGLDNWRYDCNGDLYAGGRMPFGLELKFRTAPFTVGIEVAPGIAFAPGRAGFLFDASLIARVLL